MTDKVQIEEGTYTYICQACGRVNVIHYPPGRLGALPRYCPPLPDQERSACQRAADTARVRRWRQAHPDQARALRKRKPIED